MAGKNYDIDDILNEVDSFRKKDGKPILTGTQKKVEKPAASRSSKDLSVTQILTGMPEKRDNSVARQLSEKQSEERLQRDISAAFDSRKPVKISEEHETLSARQLTEQEYEARVARDIDRAADVKLYEKNKVQPFNPDTADTAEVDKFSEHVNKFVKPEVSEDDDIIFHTRGDLVTTETMEMRKQQKIDEIKGELDLRESVTASKLTARRSHPRKCLTQSTRWSPSKRLPICCAATTIPIH